MNDKTKKKLLSTLAKLYPDPESELTFKNHYELIVCVILSAQCTDKKVNEVTPFLFKRYSSFRALSKARLGDVQRIIRPINYYRTKSKNIIRMAGTVISEFSGKLPVEHGDLKKLPGVGQKTANVIQCELGVRPAFPVDTHVFRVSRRLGLAKGKNVELVEEELKVAFPPRLWRNLHHWLIFHGRRVCKAQRPLCAECKISYLCPSKTL